MPNQNTGPAFGGQDYNGPFSEQLRPPEPTPIAVPGAKIPRQAAAAAIIDKFLDGLQRGRQQQFQQEQNQISQKRNALTSAYNQIQQDDRVTSEGAAKARQIYTNAMAGIALSDLDHGDDQSGKKSSKKKPTDQPQTAGQHVKEFAKHLLNNVVGKQPGGAVDPGSAMLAMQQAVYAKDGNPLPQYNAKSQVADIQNKIQQTQSQVPTEATWNLAQPHFGPMLDKLRFLNPQEADRKEKELRELYAPTPTPPPPGSVDDARLQAQKMFTPIPQGQAGAAAPPGAPTVTPQATGGPPPINGRQFSALRAAGMVTKESNIEYIGPDGKKTQGEGVRANVPNQGEFWYVRDASGNLQPVNQAGVREIGTAEPKADAKPTDSERMEQLAYDAFKDKNKIKGELTASQKIKALGEKNKELKESGEPEDIAISRQLTRALAQERLDQRQTEKANVKSIADGVQDGTILPDLTGVPREQKAEVQAELQRRGVNVREMQMDLLATKSFMRTMNGPRQVQLRQAVEFVVPSLDKVGDLSDELSKYLRRDKNQLLTKANLALAMSGAPGYSQEAKQAATLMNQQITDVQSELAQIYSAGGSSTNKKLEQAQQILNSSWDAKTLKSAIELARSNVQMRVNSIKNALPIGENGEIKPLEAPKDFSVNPFAASGQGGVAPPPGAGGTNPPKKQDDKNDPWKNPFAK